MIDLETRLPFWMRGAEGRAAARAAGIYWARVEDWLNQALDQADIRACGSEALRQHADDRGIVRLPGESEALWRNRVLHAITAAQASGTRAGFEYILGVYGVTGFSIEERVPGEDVDKIFISLDPNGLNGATTVVLDRVFQKWGRVCRRYVITHLQTSTQTVYSMSIDERHDIGVS